MVKLIVYDLDGTLVDTRKDISEAANQMRARMNLPPLSEQEICGYVGLGLQRLVEGCLNTTEPVKIEEGVRIYRSFYTQHLLDHTVLYPGVTQVLEHFRSRRQAVITNKPDPYSHRILEALGVAGFFTQIIAGNSGWPKKPDSASLVALMRAEGAEPDRTVFVGDSPIDMETGARAGAVTVGMVQGFCGRKELETSGPDHLLEGFPELLQLAKERVW